MKKRNAILHGVGALASALVYAFFALPFYVIKITPAAASDAAAAMGIPVGATNGYKFLDMALKQSDGTALATFSTIMALLTLIIAGIVLVASIFALLNDFHVIKNQKVGQIADWIVFGVTILFALSCILNLIGNACFVAKDLTDSFASLKLMLQPMGGTLKLTAGWALTIITTVLSLGAVATSSVAKFKK